MESSPPTSNSAPELKPHSAQISKGRNFYETTVLGRVLVTLALGLVALLLFPNINTLIMIGISLTGLGLYGLHCDNLQENGYILAKLITLFGSFISCGGILYLDKPWLGLLVILGMAFMTLGARTRNGLLMVLSMMSLSQTIYIIYWLGLRAAMFPH